MVRFAIAAHSATTGVAPSTKPLSAGACTSAVAAATWTPTTSRTASPLDALETINSFDLFVYFDNLIFLFHL